MSSQTGPCTKCRQPTIRYGPGGNPLCPQCLAPVREAQGKK
jgi:predicted amidophosphoribosyltransferase